MFRTSDIRFGLLITLAVALLILLTLNIVDKRYAVIALFVVIVFCSPFFFSGKALLGENVYDQKYQGSFFDKIISIPAEHSEMAHFLNAKNGFLYILPLPASQYTAFALETSQFVGMDIMQKLVDKPFLYLNSCNISTKAYSILLDALKNSDPTVFSYFPIKYLLLRNDISGETYKPLIAKILTDKLGQIVKTNKTFSLIELAHYDPIIKGSQPVEYTRLSPVKYKIQIKNLQSATTILFSQSFDKRWKLFPVKKGKTDNGALVKISDQTTERVVKKTYGLADWLFLFQTPLAEKSHTLADGYRNQWTLAPETFSAAGKNFLQQNSSGDYDAEFILFYQPQAVFILLLWLPPVVITGFFIFFFITRFRRRALKN